MKVAHALVFVTFAVGSATARRADACASCGCGDSTITATGVERPYKNRIRLAWEERYGSLTMGDDTTGEHTQFLRSTLAASWSPVKRLTIGAVLPWVTSWISRGPSPRTTVNGLGDFELAARGVLYQEKSFAPHHVLWAAAGWPSRWRWPTAIRPPTPTHRSSRTRSIGCTRTPTKIAPSSSTAFTASRPSSPSSTSGSTTGR